MLLFVMARADCHLWPQNVDTAQDNWKRDTQLFNAGIFSAFFLQLVSFITVRWRWRCWGKTEDMCSVSVEYPEIYIYTDFHVVQNVVLQNCWVHPVSKAGENNVQKKIMQFFHSYCPENKKKLYTVICKLFHAVIQSDINLWNYRRIVWLQTCDEEEALPRTLM